MDPGLGVTGYAILEVSCDSTEPALLDGGVLRTNHRAPLEERLHELHYDLTQVIADHQPELMAVENIYSHYNHPKTSITMAHVRGVIFLTAAQAGIPVKSYGATKIKKSLVGVGRASKEQVQRMVQQRMNLQTLPEPPDLADAIAVAYCHIDRTFRRSDNTWAVKL